MSMREVINTVITATDTSSEEPNDNLWIGILIMAILTIILVALILTAIGIVFVVRSKTFRKRDYDLFNPKYDLHK